MTVDIDKFKREQEAMSTLLSSIRKNGVHTVEGRSELINNKERLVMHLEKTVDELYPGLKTAAQKDPDLHRIIGAFEQEINEISKFCHEFFEKYATDGGGIEFFKDYERLKSALESQLQIESINHAAHEPS